MVVSQDLNAGMRCIKYMLFTFNLLFALTGVLVITIGFSINTIYSDYVMFLDSRFIPPTTLLVVTGFIIFVVAFFGCCGALRESTCMIMAFSVLLGIIFILEFSAGIAGYMLHDGLGEMLLENMNSTMYAYHTDVYAAKTIDIMQSELQCCGITNASDWNNVPGYPGRGFHQDSEILYPLNGRVPQSCCVPNEYLITPASGLCKGYYKAGCYPHLKFLIGQSALLLATAAMSIALLQLLGVMFGCSLAKAIRAQKTERLRRRQELREQLINSYSIGATDPKKTYPVIYMDHENKSSTA